MSTYAEPEILVDFASVDEVQSLTAMTDAQKQDVYESDPMSSGFHWYTPPLAAHAHETSGNQWIITGHDMQVLVSEMPPGQTITTEVGSFFFGSAGIKTNVDLTCCSGKGGCSEGCGRIMGGESCVKLLLTNESAQPGVVGLTPNFPAKVIPLKVCARWRAYTHLHEPVS
jgi:Mitochondrial biogenesis AIM24